MKSDRLGTLRVLIVHFNTPELTADLVRGFNFHTQGGRRIAIHILDNGSTVENLQLLLERVDALENVELEISSGNLGFGEGMNRLVSSHFVEDSDLLWLLNSDTRVSKECVDKLELEADIGVFDIVSPVIYSGDDQETARVWYCGGTIRIPQLEVQHQLHGSKLDDIPMRPFETQFITGAAPMMRASTFRKLGGFPPGYFLYWEDTFLCWKAREAGLRLGVVPSAQLWHAVGGSSGHGNTRTYYYWSSRNRFTFARDIGVPRWRLIVGSGGITTLRPFVSALRETDGRLAKTRAVLRGTAHGLWGHRREDRG